MRIEGVTAEAFGPLTNKALSLKPGMNVVWGPNESGKSTWHAAIYLALCGLSRARGPRSNIAKDLVQRHRPWDNPSKWKVSAMLSLDDGRHVEVRQDLVLRVGTAADARQGRDITNEIINEGSADASIWLGLNRDSFLATACVRQTTIQVVTKQAYALQEDLQRAAATAGTDETAAAAIARLHEFVRDQVGTMHPASKKPLRTAMLRVRHAESRLEEARGGYQRLADMQQEVAALENSATHIQQEIQIVQAVRARRAAQQASAELERVRRLASKHPEAPPAPGDDADVIERIHAALQAWDEMPGVVELAGKKSRELEAELGRTPQPPERETEPREVVREAYTAFGEADERLRLHRDSPPQPLGPSRAGGLASHDLRDIARHLESPPPTLDSEIESRHESARARYDELERPKNETEPAGLWTRFLRLMARFFAWMLGRKRGPSASAWAAAFEELHAADIEVRVERARIEQVATAYNAAVERAHAAGLPVSSVALFDLADEAAQQEMLAEALARWEALGIELETNREERDAALNGLLDEVEASASTDVEIRFARYAAECAARKEQASQALRRPQLQEALDTRRELETRAAEAEVRRAESHARLGAVRLELGLGETEPLDQAESVRRWLTAAKELQPAKEEARREWTDLQALLGGTSMAEMAEKARQSGEVAERLAVGIDQSKLLQADPDKVDDEDFEDLQRRHQEAQRHVGEQRGAASELASTMLNVAEAEQDRVIDRAKYERLSNVADVLNKTAGFLEQAQDRIHHDLAPFLQDAVRPALPRITGGTYTDVRVDAKSLDVKVFGPDGEWRQASLLSHGTAEQIYLLLRVGLAKHLTAPNETCPLILDDVTVECDSHRKAAVLELLHEMSRDRQVILFSQETEVLEWAKASLGEADQLLDLSPARSRRRRGRKR